MKRIKFLLLTAFGLVALLALFSCGTDPQDDSDHPSGISSAEELFGKIDAVMSDLESYEAKQAVNMTVYMQNHEINASGELIEIFADTVDDDRYFYSKSTLTTSSESLKLNKSYMDIRAYHQGNAFYFTSVGSAIKKFYSPLSYEDFLEYYSYNASATLDDEKIFSCSNSSYTQNENGSWEICLSGYSADFIDDYAEIMGLDDEMLDDKPVDMEIIIKAAPSFRATQMSLRMIFEDDNNDATNPTVELISYYSAYNEATPITDTLDTGNYTQVSDVRLVDGFDYMIEKLKESEENTFTLDVTQDYGYDIIINEKDVITYGREDGYYYNVTSTVGDTEGIISYRSGKQTVTSNGSSNTVDQTEDEAEALINDLIDYAMYDIFNVEHIEKTDDGRYKVTAVPSMSFCLEITSSLGVHYVSSTQTIYFTVEDMNIIKIESTIEIRYSITYNSPASREYISIYSVADFT